MSEHTDPQRAPPLGEPHAPLAQESPVQPWQPHPAQEDDLLGTGQSPQLLLRGGYGANDRPTPCRAVADVFTDAPTSTGTSS